jgi:hypothetical protein
MRMTGALYAAACRDVAGILVARAIPCVGYALATRHVRLLAKLGIATICIALTLTLDHDATRQLATIVLWYGYFIAVSTVVPLVARQLRDRRMTPGAVFVWSACVFVGLPSLLSPSEAVATIAVALGWDMMLASYSYCIEKTKASDDLPMAECMFFLLVNPALVFARRGVVVAQPQLNIRGLGRIAIGIVTFLFVSSVLYPAYEVVRRRDLGYYELLGVALSGAIRFLIEYGRQSALASVQIGLLRQLGHNLPERYRWPIVSSGPLDFFRRWNTYIGQWLLRYIFWPLSLELGKGNRTRRYREKTTAFALIATFAACGLLHDAAIYAAGLHPGTAMLRVFLVAGLLAVASVAFGRLWHEAERKLHSVAALELVRVCTARVALWATAIGVFYKWFP